jgi:SAM-dependent methyltransferase
MINNIENDVFGAAVSDYYYSRLKWKKEIIVNSGISGKEKISVKYLFRTVKQMPLIEQKALSMCQGKILDVGACAGSHSLEIQKNGYDVTALEISALCCEVIKKRGVKDVVCADIYKYNQQKYDSILLMMNGIGIAGTIKGLAKLLKHLKSLLLPEGKIIFDSSDIEYAYIENDGSKWINLNNDYYGQVSYNMQYKNIKGENFDWLFIDAEKMKQIAEKENLNFVVIEKGSHYDYLGVLSACPKG